MYSPRPASALRTGRPPAVVRASTRTTVSVTSTDSTNTPSTEENSSSSSCSSTSFTAKDCRPHHHPAGRFSGELNRHHTKINSRPACTTTRSGPEPKLSDIVLRQHRVLSPLTDNRCAGSRHQHQMHAPGRHPARPPPRPATPLDGTPSVRSTSHDHGHGRPEHTTPPDAGMNRPVTWRRWAN
jgi:hypothetical protein